MKSKKTLNSRATAWAFILPAVLVVLTLMVYPLLSSIFYSFTNKNLIKPRYSFKGFENYEKILADPVFWRSFWNNIKWTAASLFGQVLVGFTAALDCI